MTREQLNEVLRLHKKWLNKEPDGKRADLSGAVLQYADLEDEVLKGADLTGADLKYADLKGTDLRGTDLKGADLDFSYLPLWCGSLGAQFDDRQIIQLLYHVVCAGLQSKNTSEETKEVLRGLIPTANRFHRADECGIITSQ